MAQLTDLSAELITSVCDHLSSSSVLALRQSCRDLKGKADYSFLKLFKSVKISLCQVSIDTFDEMTRDVAIAYKIEDLTLGTETLDQYRFVVDSMQGENAEQHRASYEVLLKHEKEARTEVATRLREICVRLPNLQSLSVEDRPASTFGKSDGDHLSRNSLSSTQIERLTGISLRWNGPYGSRYLNGSTSVYPDFPLSSRRFAYTVAFVLLRDLDILMKPLELNILMCSYRDSDEELHIAPVFDINKQLPRSVLAKHLVGLDIDQGLHATQDAWFASVYFFAYDAVFGRGH